MFIGNPQEGYGIGTGVGDVVLHTWHSFLLGEEVQTGEVPPEFAAGEHGRKHAGGEYIGCIKIQACRNPELESSFPINDGG